MHRQLLSLHVETPNTRHGYNHITLFGERVLFERTFPGLGDNISIHMAIHVVNNKTSQMSYLSQMSV